MRELREIFGQEPGVREWWTPGKVGSVGIVNFHTNDHAWTFPEEIQWKEVLSRVKAVVAHLRSSEGRSSALQKGVIGDQGRAHPSCGERHLTHGTEMGIDGEWKRGRVLFKKLRTEEHAVTISNSTSTDLVYT